MKRLLAMPIAAGLLLAGCGTRDEQIRSIVRDELNAAMQRTAITPVTVIGPYSPAVKVGRFVFVSGQIGLDQQTGRLKNETMEIETRQVLENLNRILRAAGCDSTSVVSATVYLKNMNDYQKMNQVYGAFFPEGNYPARVAVQVGDLPKQANIEISVIAFQ